MNNIVITIKKELRSILRDKKVLMTLFIYPLMILFMVILYGNIYDNLDTENKEYNIGVDYTLTDVENNILGSLNIKYNDYQNKEEMQKAYEDDLVDAYISYNNETNTYTIYSDDSGTTGLTLKELLYNYLNLYSDSLTNQYLLSKNIDLDEAYNHFSVLDVSLSNNNYVVTLLISISLTYIILSICIATSNCAISATATEKENGTLETILTFPITKTELIMGKYLACVVLGFIAAIASLIIMVISLYVGKNVYKIFETIDIVLSFSSIISSILITFFASVFISGISLLLTALAKTYKEAQSQIGILNLVASVPMFIGILGISINDFYYLIPVCNFTQLLKDIFTNNIYGFGILLAGLSTIIYTVIVINLIIKSYNKEKILFS